MLKDAPFWEDLVPEDPPSLMPDVERSAPPASSPDAEAVLGENISPVCPRDGFPMLHLNGKLQCSVEYIARCVGDQRVVDMVQQGRITYYIFENGHQLPLLCACCGQGLRVPDVIAECKQMQGRRLEAMRLEQRVTKRGRHFNELVLEFSKSGFFSRALAQPVSFEVAVKMRHQSDCPYGKRTSSTAKKKSRGKKRGRGK